MSQVGKCSNGPAFITINGGWMIGPAFISAPDSASPQGSITPGKALSITLRGCDMQVPQARPHLVEVLKERVS